MVDQCIQGEGLVQVNVQIQFPQRRMNIVDVLKPAEDYVEMEDSSRMYLKKKEVYFLIHNLNSLTLFFTLFQQQMLKVTLSSGW